MTTDTYTGDLDWFRIRSLATAAAFFVPYLKRGMSLLDCGCGPGTITLGFAEALAPGIVTGIDIQSEMIEQIDLFLNWELQRLYTFMGGNLHDQVQNACPASHRGGGGDPGDRHVCARGAG